MTKGSLVVGGVVALILVGAGTAFVPGIAPGGDTDVGTESSPTETTGGNTTDNVIADGETTGNEMADRETTDGETTDGETADGETADGETTDGETTDGETADGETADGETADSETADGETADSETTDEETTADAQPFVISTDSIEECGRTCRDVTSVLTNQQATTAENVTVSTNLYAGKGTDGDTLWEGSEAIGTLSDGESYTTTTRINLGFGDAYAIKQSDGWITIRTTVQTANQTVTFTEQRQVA